MSLELETGWVPALLGWLDAGDIEMSFIMGVVEPAHYEGILLKRYGVALTLGREHPLAAATSMSPEDVARYPIEAYPRALYPKLWDALYAPLINAGAQFVEVPEIADHTRSPDAIAAFFDFGADDPGSVIGVRVPLAAPATVPFQLLRRRAELSAAGEEFWELAKCSIAAPQAAR
ncbi:LysR substrate-binding domain-containing protein [Sphingobium sp. AN558]|uniref:LysR substrate-binding domain-containing protein n=1 Tax=Sphingobium sp. AN558 TaxID=3133442 RepID=UPI0030C42A97